MGIWSLTLQADAPAVGQTYTVPVLVDSAVGKRVTYTNTWPTKRTFKTRSSRPDVVDIRPDSEEVTLEPGETAYLRVVVKPYGGPSPSDPSPSALLAASGMTGRERVELARSLVASLPPELAVAEQDLQLVAAREALVFIDDAEGGGNVEVLGVRVVYCE